MVLLNRVVEVFDLPDLDQPEPSIQQQQQPVDVLQSCQVRAALVDDDGVVTLSFSGWKGQRLVDIQATQAAIFHASKASSRW
ncbi:hypothetical protein U8P68_25220 (plasmid) [Rhizobium ruizarguesonis]|nr:hypothetical protein [Rhizobium ruizarguesonis]UFW99283.1 hypothetical protein RlegTA1_35495 [Rhizobium ruizarguesonis]WSH04231.1 hypothetical protein U8P71_26875 [Rhizobium ruizarguesonis]WSH24982.1 hypothetical protein U8Q07_33270 [Rhizobium ruizarguesonis]WSH36692.1 hypothetical protein U8P70_26410 [Rhizobium ruizarguesonis]WSH60803.1 hypothetical protein U8P68_25220 [Rhizobium ruizarguesonis]